ncbi:MAG: tripartite tricarboxylate transporter substrate binding protein [Rhizobiales bacterium]|nr:tripartite tricarboxylate transporter substrate binding protein [Hyphomicrobiales bacterium]
MANEFSSGHGKPSHGAAALDRRMPFAPGGVTDVTARYVAQLMSGALGQSVIIENRSGGGGAIGATAAAHADPDGYTLLVVSSATHSILPATHEKLDYDPIKSFEPISGMSNAPYLLVANKDLPVKDAKEMAQYAKVHFKTFNVGAATGTPPHILAYVLKQLIGADFNVPLYRGGSPAMADLFSGQVQAMFQPTTIVLPLANDKRIRVLGAATEERLSVLPDVPTLTEQGFPGLVANSWNGLAAPAGTPAPIVNQLSKVVRDVFNSAELKGKFESLGITPIAGTPEQLGTFMKKEAVSWQALVKLSKMPKVP